MQSVVDYNKVDEVISDLKSELKETKITSPLYHGPCACNPERRKKHEVMREAGISGKTLRRIEKKQRRIDNNG